ncbi:LCP family protein [Bacillus sp. AR18-7]|uniref:LCP family protein n=1 Tax=Bacillus sp. AR18-7 TaxID=2217821 RepID=UPI00351A5F1C
MAHAFGGVDATIDTVENFLDIPIDYYVKFNFDSFLNLIDTIGGIDVDVPITFIEQDSQDQVDAIHVEKGYQHLNGEQALALARTRHIDNDFMRGKRQQLVIEAIGKKLLSMNSLSKFNSIIDKVSPHMSNLSLSLCIRNPIRIRND